MGGAERAERRRRQQQRTTGSDGPTANRGKSGGKNAGAKAVAAARGGTDTRRVPAIVGVVVLVVAVVVGGLIWTNSAKNATEGENIPTATATADLPERRDGSVVVVGEQDAPATIDVYADFLCPACGQFEQQYGEQIRDRVAQGQLAVRNHMVPMLTERSDPAGYSLHAANAALLAADAGTFTEYHDSLFAAQPGEGARAYDKDQLIQLGRDLGITDPAFAEGVRNGKYEDLLNRKMEQVESDSSLHRDLGRGPAFATPLVVADGEVVDAFNNPNWLDDVVADARAG
ncbi:DsbA family protein [Saccharomonospora iraqiensis]|uniref:DsbA family protein n=1 Tax=Saccharomonospora iraqiensis TaxID=52698 RepID=UPI00022E2B80|nr:thioredoxin domain-containing protein [Saccharomonospora iraqiensis]